ncbi:hypothetical protein AX15_004641 [Amanita polypyramis BW_CC]|nr:hypothetical protein AX15_004641 [Amanita polypyramis BW_CC]
MGDHGYQNVINGVNALCDFFTLPVHLRLMSVFYNYRIPQLLRVPSICKPSELDGDDSEDFRHQIFLRLQFYEDYPLVFCEEKTSKAFERFMHNPGRSREFYASPQVRHGRIAEICLQELVLAVESSREPEDYEGTYWVYHLLQSKPGDEGIRTRLKRL